MRKGQPGTKRGSQGQILSLHPLPLWLQSPDTPREVGAPVGSIEDAKGWGHKRLPDAKKTA